MASPELFSGFPFSVVSAWLFLSQLLKFQCFSEVFGVFFFPFLFNIEFSVSFQQNGEPDNTACPPRHRTSGLSFSVLSLTFPSILGLDTVNLQPHFAHDQIRLLLK